MAKSADVRAVERMTMDYSPPILSLPTANKGIQSKSAKRSTTLRIFDESGPDTALRYVVIDGPIIERKQSRRPNGQFGFGDGSAVASTAIATSNGSIDLGIDSAGTMTLDFEDPRGNPATAYLHGSEDIHVLADSVDGLRGHVPDPGKASDAVVDGKVLPTEGGDGNDIDVVLYNSGVITVTFDARELTQEDLDLDPGDQAPFSAALRDMAGHVIDGPIIERKQSRRPNGQFGPGDGAAPRAPMRPDDPAVAKATGEITWINENADMYTQELPVGKELP